MTIGFTGDATTSQINQNGTPVVNITSTGITSGVTGGALYAGTAQTTTSGTTKDFTGIPSWAKRVVMLPSGVSTNGTSVVQVQVGTSGGIVNTGYVGTADAQSSGGGTTASFTSGLALERSGLALAGNIRSGRVVFEKLEGSNTWIGTYIGTITTGTTAVAWGATSITLGGTLDRIRLTTVNGTDTFDAGSVNILYE